MKKIAIVYWSGTGNTAQMAEAVAEGAGAAGAQANLFTPSDFSPAQVKDYDAIAFGCPAMGAEELESDEFEPVWEACKPALAGRPVALLRQRLPGRHPVIAMNQSRPCDSCRS